MINNDMPICQHPLLLQLMSRVTIPREQRIVRGSLAYKQLRASLLWFGVLAAILSSFAVFLTQVMEPGLEFYALLAIPGAIASSVLCWWMFIVRPQRVSIQWGIFTGIASVVLASFFMWLPIMAFAITQWSLPSWNELGGTLWSVLLAPFLFGLVTICVFMSTLLGWLFFLIGGSAGGLSAWTLSRIIASEANEQVKQ